MLVSELFQKLSRGVFSNLSLGSDGSGVIEPSKKPKLLGYAQDALDELHTRFSLRDGACLIEQQAWMRSYKLSSKFSLSNPARPSDVVGYIIDTPDRLFSDDVCKILEVIDQSGSPLILNDRRQPMGAFTPLPDTVQIAKPVQGAPLSVQYQALHPKLVDETSNIDLPKILFPALEAYVAYLAYTHMNGQEHTAKAAEHMQVFETKCQIAEQMGISTNDLTSTNTRFSDGGWI